MDFSTALLVLKAGGRIKRWKWEFGRSWLVMMNRPIFSDSLPGFFIGMEPCIGIKYPGGTVQNWVPQLLDLMSDDWVVIGQESRTILDQILEIHGFRRLDHFGLVIKSGSGPADTPVTSPAQPCWPSIESAPKDGTDLLLFDPDNIDGTPVFVGRWMGDYWSGTDRDGRPSYPTHWMRLPAVPSSKASDGESYERPDVAIPITGYRRLSTAEIELINRIKSHEAETMRLVREVQDYMRGQRFDTVSAGLSNIWSPASIERDRLDNAEPERWAALARTDLQTGFMFLVRAVAQPVTP